MNLREAQSIGASKLNINLELFVKCVEAARKMDVRDKDLGPMVLAIAILGGAKATDPKEMASELTDALALIAKAETEWRMEQKAALH